MKINGQQTAAAQTTTEVQLVVENGTTNTNIRRRVTTSEVVHVLLRLLCLVASVTAMAVMVTAKQSGSISFYGFQIQLYSKWSFSNSYLYVVGATATTAAYSLLQLLVGSTRLLTTSPIVPSKYQAWLFFAGDQIFAYMMMSAGSAAAGVSNLNRTGIRHTALPDFCKALGIFCDRVAVSVVFTFFSCVLLAVSAVQDVIWLSNLRN